MEIPDPHIGKALLRVASHMHSENVMLASVEVGLLSTTLLNSFISAHCDRGAAVTRAARLPKGIELYAFSKDYLEALQMHFGEDFPFHPGRGLQVQSFIGEQGRTGNDQAPMLFQDIILRPTYDVSWPDVVDLSLPKAITQLGRIIDETQEDDLLDAWYKKERKDERSIFVRTTQLRNRRRAYVNQAQNVLFVSNACGYSGAEGSLVELLRHLDSERYRVTVLLSLEGYLSTAITPYVERCIVYGDDFARYSTRTMLQLREIFHEIKPSLVHFNSNEGMPCVSLCLALGIPYVQHIRNGDLTGFRRGIEGADAIVAVSRYLAKKVAVMNPAANNIHVIYDEVDSQKFTPEGGMAAESRAEIGIALEAPTVLMIARFVPNKRHDVLIAAMAVLVKRLPKVRLLLKGDNYGPDSSYSNILSLLEASGVASFTTHLQFVSDIRKLYDAANVLVLCSDDEGLGRCVVEAMAMGLPVVVTNTGGTHEIVDDGISGIVIPGNDPVALEGALYTILTNSEKAAEMGEAGRRTAMERLSAVRSASTMMSIYDALTNDRSATLKGPSESD